MVGYGRKLTNHNPLLSLFQIRLSKDHTRSSFVRAAQIYFQTHSLMLAHRHLNPLVIWKQLKPHPTEGSSEF